MNTRENLMGMRASEIRLLLSVWLASPRRQSSRPLPYFPLNILISSLSLSADPARYSSSGDAILVLLLLQSSPRFKLRASRADAEVVCRELLSWRGSNRTELTA